MVERCGGARSVELEREGPRLRCLLESREDECMIIHFNLDALKNSKKSLDPFNISLAMHPTPKRCIAQ